MKTCFRCKEVKPLTAFYADKVKKDGLASRCKSCRVYQSRQWALAHPQERQRIMRDWKSRTNQKDHNRKTWLKRSYGKTVAEIDSIFVAQRGECAICTTYLTQQYHVDHCHHTGKVRGLLCRHCNLGLGFFQDSPTRLIAGAEYLARFAA